MRSLVINCRAPPFVPEGWSLSLPNAFASTMETLVVDPELIQPYFAPGQEAGRHVNYGHFARCLRKHTVLCANTLDALLADPSKIPRALGMSEHMRLYRLCFPATLYMDDAGHKCVRTLYLHRRRVPHPDLQRVKIEWPWIEEWRWGKHLLGNGFGRNEPAAVLMTPAS